jgi:hypothetical protein
MSRTKYWGFEVSLGWNKRLRQGLLCRAHVTARDEIVEQFESVTERKGQVCHRPMFFKKATKALYYGKTPQQVTALAGYSRRL